MSEFLSSSIEIANTHAKRLSYAVKKLKSKFPLTAEKITALTDQEIETFELFTSRFAKLQDFMGNKLFNLILDKAGEYQESMTLIDKINKLEKLKLIDSAADWQILRQVRNHLAHEYPDHPELTAKYLNEAYDLSEKLLNTLATLVKYVQQ